MNIEQEIRDQIENIKKLKQEVGYINNHLSILEGFCREDKQKQVDDAYKRGLEDAWEAAKKLYLNGACKSLFGEYFNTFIKNHTAQEAIDKIKAYEEKQKANDDIKVGDEVIDTQSGARFCVTHFWVNNHGEKGVSGFNHECSALQDTNDNVKKTGRHFDIDRILETMRT